MRPHTIPRTIPARIAALALAALSLAAACGDSTSPPTLPVTYALQRVDGGQLPIVLASDGVTETVLLGEQMVLRGDGTGWRRTYIGERPVGSTAWPMAIDEPPADIRHRRVDGSLVIETRPPCPADADCVPADTAAQTATGLVVVTYRLGERRVLRLDVIVLED